MTFLPSDICRVNLDEQGDWRVENGQQKVIQPEGVPPAWKA